MRLKSAIFVSALLRTVHARGDFGAVLRKGAEDAGAIFIVHARGPSANDLYGPAPQLFIDADSGAERFFECIGREMDSETLAESLERQASFDPDCWMVELETVTLPDAVRVVGGK